MAETAHDPLLKVGPITVDLVERLYDMGCQPPQWGRVKGSRQVWIGAVLPEGRKEAHGDTLDHAARLYFEQFLTCSDKERAAAVKS